MKKILAIALALVMVVAFSAVALADGPMGNGTQGGPSMGGQMQMGGGPQGSPMGNGLKGSQMGSGQQPPEMPSGEAPQGGFEQNGQQPPEMPNGEALQGGFEQNGQQPPEKPDGEDMAPHEGGINGQNGPMGGPGMGGQDPLNAMFDAVNALEDETVKANITELMQAEFDAIVAERDAEDKDAAAEAVAVAREALQAALTEAGIEAGFGPMDGQGRMDGQPPMDGQDQMGNAPGMGGMNGFDPIGSILEAVNALNDETVKANIEALLQAELDAMEAEREATDKEAAAETVAAAREALQAALAEAGIEFTMPEMGGQFNGQQPPEMPGK